MRNDIFKNILLLDTIGAEIIIGFFDGVKLRTKTLQKESSHKIHSAISCLILNTNYLIRDLDAIGVISGPGSFTGVRLGVTIANALAYALKIPIYAIDSLTAQGIKNGEAILPASHSEVYSAHFKNGNMVGKIKLLPKVEMSQCNISTESKFPIKNLLQMILSGSTPPQTQILPIYIKKPNITKKPK